MNLLGKKLVKISNVGKEETRLGKYFNWRGAENGSDGSPTSVGKKDSQASTQS
jgi:hypothetical protein